MADLLGMGCAYATMAHLGGLIAGALLMPLVLRGRTPTPGTNWLKHGLQGYILRWRETTKKGCESKVVARGTLVALLIILALLVFTTDIGPTNSLLEMFLIRDNNFCRSRQ